MQASDRKAAIAFLRSHPEYFWNWSDDGETFVWRDGRTIAFREELIAVLRRFGDTHPPPLGAVLLLLAACRDSWGEGANEFETIRTLFDSVQAAQLAHSDGSLSYESQAAPPWLADVFHGLDQVHHLPTEVRRSTAAKSEIVSQVCEGTRHANKTTTCPYVVEALEQRWHTAVLDVHHESLAALTPTAYRIVRALLTDLLHTFYCLREGLDRLDVDSLALRRDTGLDALPEPAEVTISPGEQIQNLLRELESDQELAGVARLARNLMAAVHLPRPMSQREEMPLGGVSDIANRGSLDRLLLSELAHDDLTLAVRVAMNEALYLRRESPPRQPPRERLVLVDSGLRMWGVPRTFASSVALALAATSDRDVVAQIFRAERSAATPIDLRTREGLTNHLATLTTTAHPGEALSAFVQEWKRLGSAGDAVVVVSDDAWSDPDFSLSLSALEAPQLHVAVVSRDGDFQLYSVTQRGRKLVREAKLSLDDLIPKHKPAAPLIDETKDLDLPAICRVRPFPLLLSHSVTPERIWWVSAEPAYTFTLTRDGRLMRWRDGKEGASQLADDLPSGKLHWAALHRSSDGLFRAVVGKLHPRGLWLIAVDPDEGVRTRHQLQLNEANPRWVAVHEETLFVIYPHAVEAFSAQTGVSKGIATIPRGAKGVHGRYFRSIDGNIWYALAHDGLELKFVPMPIEAKTASQLTTIFEYQAMTDAVGVTREGDLYSFHRNGIRTITPLTAKEYSTVAVSRDGTRIALREVVQPSRTHESPANDESRKASSEKQEQASFFVVDVFTLACEPGTGNPFHAVEKRLEQSIRANTSPRHRFSAISLRMKMVVLTSPNGQQHVLRWKSESGHIGLSPMDGRQVDTALEEFQSCAGPPGVGYELRSARWRDGSKAWLDSRGLLHLRSSNKALPEATIVLADGKRLAGWLSDGRTWGDRYFLGADPTMADQEFMDQYLTPFASRLS